MNKRALGVAKLASAPENTRVEVQEITPLVQTDSPPD
jgi:hypothetical protein